MGEPRRGAFTTASFSCVMTMDNFDDLLDDLEADASVHQAKYGSKQPDHQAAASAKKSSNLEDILDDLGADDPVAPPPRAAPSVSTAAGTSPKGSTLACVS